MRGSFRKAFASPMVSDKRGIAAARSSSIVISNKPTNSSMDFVSMQRSGPSAVASMFGSQEAKHSPRV